MTDSNAFVVPGNDNGSEDETDIIPGPLSYFRPVPGRENSFHPPIRCHFSRNHKKALEAGIFKSPLIRTLMNAKTR